MIQAARQPATIHPIVAFSVLAFAFSWLIWGVIALFPAQPEIVTVWTMRLGTFGPAAAAMVMAWMLNPTPVQARSRVWWVIFIASVFFGWLYYSWKGDLQYTARFPVIAYALAAGVMVIWGLMVAGIAGHSEGIRRLMRRQVTFPGWGLMLFVVVMPLVIEFTGIVVTNLSGGQVQPWLIKGTWDELLPVVVSVFIGTWIAGGGNEESGWRGFMQAQMQKQFSPLMSAVIVGIVMGLWHFPLHFLGVYANMGLYDGLGGLVFRIVSNIALGIAFAWLYNRSRGSLLVVILFHVVINTSSVFIASTTLTQILMFAVTLSLIPIGRMWEKLPAEKVAELV